MEVKKADDRILEIESPYNLMQVFNAINQERNSLIFAYHAVTFWRADHQFMTEQQENIISLGEVVDFDEFKAGLSLP